MKFFGLILLYVARVRVVILNVERFDEHVAFGLGGVIKNPTQVERWDLGGEQDW